MRDFDVPKVATALDDALSFSNAGYMAASHVEEEHDRDALRIVFHTIGELIKEAERLLQVGANGDA